MIEITLNYKGFRRNVIFRLLIKLKVKKIRTIREDGLIAGPTRLELATSCVTGRRSNQLNYDPNGKKVYNEQFIIFYKKVINKMSGQIYS